jgi:hypothetical protein
VNLDDLDRILAGYLQAIDTMATNMVELDGDPNRKLLAGATLTGVTKQRWDPANEAFAQMWGWFSQFKELYGQAKEIRGSKSRLPADQEAELARILTGPCVELATGQVPVAERKLLGANQTTLRCTLDDLLQRMSRAYDQVRSVTTATGQAWDELLPRLQATTAELNRLRDLAASLGETHVPELQSVRTGLDRLSATLATDPLSVDLRAADELQHTLAATGADLDRLARLRQQAAAEVDRVRSTLAALQDGIAEAQAAYEETSAKISRPVVSPPAALDPSIAEAPDRLNALIGAAKWRAFRDAVDRWTATADHLLQEVHSRMEAARAPLDARNELRGRLDAYRAKASAFGLLEDTASSALYDQARAVLYTAPTDLSVAVALVDRYRKAIPLTPPSREASL